jgi:parvulin-like peptidyl-prolyl isomerase
MREYRSRHEREAEIQRLVILGTALAAGIALIILVLAVANDQLLVPNQAVANVNGTTINVGQFRTRAKIERVLLSQQLNNALSIYSAMGQTPEQLQQLITNQQPYSAWYSQLTLPDQLGNSVLNAMVEDELIRQKAQELGITVSDAEIDAEIQKTFGFDPETAGIAPTATLVPTETPTPLVSPTPSPVRTLAPTATVDLTTVTPTVTPLPSATASPTLNATEEAEQANENSQTFFAQIRNSTGVSDADIRNYFRAIVLREKVRDAVISDVAHTAPFVNARHILVTEESEANTALQALQNGESFSSLAKALSTDGSAQAGGELGWKPVTDYVTEFADALETAEVGVLTGPVKTQYGFHIIQLRAREDREMTDDQYEAALNNKFATYLKDLRAADTTNVQLFDAWTDNVPTEPVYVPSV